MHRRGAVLCAAALALAATQGARASQYYGRVLFNGVAVPGATVTMTQGGKSFSTVSDVQGIYQFADLPDGAWKLRIDMQGFAAMDSEVTVTSTTPAGKWELKLLSLEQMLAISKAHPPQPPPVLQPRPAVAPAKKTTETAENAPPEPPPDTNADKAADGLLVNGSESNAATSKYNLTPAFGNKRQGAKGLYNGSIGLIANQAAFDARPYSLTGLQTPKADYSHLTAVFTLGGPLRIPHLMRNGPTFFVAYQWTRDRDATSNSGLVPTLAQRGGDLSGIVDAQGNPVPIYDPLTGARLTGTVAVNPQAQALLQLYPLPNLAGSTRYNYQTQVLGDTHADALQAKLNKGFGRRDQVYGGFALRSLRSNSTNLFGFVDTTNTLGIDSNIHWSHRLPHRVLADVGYRFSRLRTQVRPNFDGVRNISGDAGITGNNQDATNWGPPALTFSSGISALSDAQSAFNRNRTDALSVSATYTRPRQTITFGGDFRRQEFNQLSQANPRGAFAFTGAATGNAAAASSGSDLADFLLGVPDTSQIAFGNADKYFRQSVYDAFVTDDWRLKPELTVTAGMRWDYGAPLTELFGRLVNLDIAQGFTAEAPVLGSSPTGTLTGTHYPSSLVRPDRSEFQPRVGIAWRPDPTNSMVIRAGYGIYVDTSVYLTAAQQMAQQAPLSKSLSVSNSSSCALTLADGFRSCGDTTASTFALDPNFRVGYAQVFNLSVQRDLPGSIVLTAGYLGTKGTHGPQEILPNTEPIGAADPCPQCPSGFIYRTSGGNSFRNAGQLQMRRRLRSGFAASLDYTFARSVDNDSELGGQGHVVGSSTTTTSGGSSGGSGNSVSTVASSAATSTTSVVAQNWLDLRAERSRSSFDQRHLLKLQMQYTSGMGLGGGTLLNGWRGRLLKEWTVYASLSAGTGMPETPIYYATVPGTGYSGTIRANRTNTPIYGGPAGYFLNSAAYTAPGTGQWGTAGRNSITGPNQVTFDSALARTFRVRDKLNLDIRADATNLLNHVAYTSWVSVINSTTFGQPAGTGGMRSLQITGRLRF